MSGYIKGQDRNQMVLYRETMDEMVSEENEVRVIDRFVDVMDIEEKGIERARPNMKGRNAYDPRDLLKLYLYGYRNKIRSSRKLARLCETNIEVMWLIRGLRPDFRTISDFRKNNVKALKEVFKETVMIAEKMKLLGEVASQDGYKVEAVNSKERNYTLNKLDERIERAKKKVKELEIYLEEMDEVDKKETKEEELKITEEMVEEMKRRVEEKKTQKKKKENEIKKLETIREEMEESGESQKSLTDKDARLMKNNGKFSVCYNVQELVDSKSHIVENYEANNNPADMGSMERVSSEAKETMGRCGVISNVTDQGYKDREDMRECLERGIIPEVTPGDDKEYEIEFEYEENEITKEEKESDKKEDIKKCLRAGVIPEVYKEVLSEVRVEEKTEIKTIEEIEAEEEIDEEDIRRMAIENECFIKDKKHNKVYCPSGETLRKKSISKKDGKIKYCNKEACKRCKKPCTVARFKEVFMYESQIILSTGEKGKELKKKYNPQKKTKKEKKKVVKVTLKPKEEDLKIRMGTSEHVHGTLKRTDDARYLLLRGTEKVNGELALSYCAVNIRRLINLVGVKEILRHLEERMEKRCTV